MTLVATNVGFGQAIIAGTTPPSNIKQLWYNENVGEFKHYYYDIPTSTWLPVSSSSSSTAAWGSIMTGTGVSSQTDLISYLNSNYLQLSGGTISGDIIFTNSKLLKGTSTLTPSSGNLTYSNSISLSEFHTGIKGMVLKTVKNSNTSVFTSITTGEIINLNAGDGTNSTTVSITSSSFASQVSNSAGGSNISNNPISVTLNANNGMTGGFSYLTVANGAVSIGSNAQADLRTDNLTTARTVQFPDKSGTFAYLSDIVTVSASNGLTLTSGNISLGGSLTTNTSIDGNFNFLIGQTTPLINYKIKNIGLFRVDSDDGAGNVSSIIQDPGTFVSKYTNGTINNAIEVQISYLQSTYYDGTYTSIIRNDLGGVAIQTNPANSFYAYLRSDNLTDIRTFQFADSNGTLLISGGVNTLTANTTVEGAFQFIAGGVTPLTVHRITTSLANVLTNISGTYTSTVVVSTNSVNISSFDSSVSHTSFFTAQSEFAIMSFNNGFTTVSAIQTDINGIGISTDPTSTIFSYLKADNLTVNRTFQFQDKSGIIALTSDILGNYIAKTTTYLSVVTDDIIECTTGTFTVTLFTSVSNTGKKLYIKNSGSGTITVAANSGETIDGSTTITLVAGDGRILVSNGSGWIKF